MHGFATGAGTVVDIKVRDGALYFLTRSGAIRRVTYAQATPEDVENLERTDLLP